MPHKLLLADDSVTIQRVIELTFADEDVQVIAVGDGRQAIERLQTEPPDIVLADIGMPERDGYEVASFIRTTPSLAHIPVLLLTGAFEPIDEGRARAAGCDGVLVKPFEPQMVITRVKELIAGRRPPEADQGAPHAAPPPVADTMRAATVQGRPPASEPAPPGSGAPSGSIEDYFDRLDAAFATMDPPAAPPPRDAFLAPPPGSGAPGGLGLADELAQWDPDLSPSDTAPQETAPPASAPAPSEAAPAAPAPPVAAPPAAAPVPTLAEAFAALLAAEKGREFSHAAAARDVLDDDVVAQVTERVIERLGNQVVREAVLDIAERLVREEIARIKANAG